MPKQIIQAELASVLGHYGSASAAAASIRERIAEGAVVEPGRYSINSDGNTEPPCEPFSTGLCLDGLSIEADDKRNGLTVHHEGGNYFLDLDEHEAQHMRTFVQWAKDLPAEARGPYRQERANKRSHMHASFMKSSTVEEISSQLADLDQNDRLMINTLIAVINAGHNTPETGGNWIYEVCRDLLFEVSFEGPFAANERNPRMVLSDIGNAIAEFWSWVDNAKDLAERHQRLFAPPIQPESVPGPVAASTKPKAARTRKAKRKAA